VTDRIRVIEEFQSFFFRGEGFLALGSIGFDVSESRFVLRDLIVFPVRDRVLIYDEGIFGVEKAFEAPAS
jgi:hypothetical protein